MKLASGWPGGDYPVFYNPSDEEIVQIASEQVDTLRIVDDDNGNVGVASGYGNTHYTIIRSIRDYCNPYFDGQDFILAYKFDRWYWSNCGQYPINREYIGLVRGYNYCSPQLKSIIKTFVSMKGQ